MLTFFIISFLTNILGAILPDAKTDFNLTLAMAGILPFAFFIAYGVMSIPSGYLVERYGEKKMMISAFTLATFANFMFVLMPNYITFITSLFLVGAGMAALQVIINPLLRTAGGEEHYSFYCVMGQLVFGLASFVSPVVFSYLVVNLKKENFSAPLINIFYHLVPHHLLWTSIYWICAITALFMIIILIFIKFPTVELQEEEKIKGGAVILELLKNKTTIMFFFGLFAYVGTEQGFNNWMSKFLNLYHGYNPDTIGANAVSHFWLLMTIGGIFGLILLKFFDVKKILSVFIILTMVFLTTALTGSGSTALFSFSACGFLLSVMYPGVFSLGLNSIDKHHGTFAGILCTGICGGAIVPLAIGGLGQIIGLKGSMCLLYLTLLYMLYIAIFSRPLIKNKTFFN
ncbi:MAG: MFS transporter [Gammaproteobacteria bacterium]